MGDPGGNNFGQNYVWEIGAQNNLGKVFWDSGERPISYNLVQKGWSTEPLGSQSTQSLVLKHQYYCYYWYYHYYYYYVYYHYYYYYDHSYYELQLS